MYAKTVVLTVVVCALLNGALLADPAWTHSTADISQARYYLVGAAADDLALFAGGRDAIGPGAQNSGVVDIYDSATGAWFVDALSAPRTSLAATGLGHLAFFAGGYGSNGYYGSPVVDIFDARTRTWTTSSMGQGKFALAAAAAGGKAVFGGGCTEKLQPGGWPWVDTDTADIYDVATGTWTREHLSQARDQLAATAVGNKIIFAGGRYAVGDSAVASDVVDIYDTTTGQWSSAHLSQPRAFLAATTVGHEAIFAGGYIGGGVGPSAVVDIYDADADSWRTTTLSTARGEAAATVIGDFALIGGGNSGSRSDVVDVYDARTGLWSVLHLSEGRYALAAASVGDAAVFAGGWPGADNYVMSNRADLFSIPEPMSLGLLAIASLALTRPRRGVRR